MKNPSLAHVSISLFLVLALAACVASKEAQTPPTLKFAVTDIEGLEQLQVDFGPFKEALEEKTGFTFEFYPVSSRTAVVEALKAKNVDVLMAGPAEYVVIHKLTQAKPPVGFQRANYTSAIITTKNSGVTTLEGLKGKKIAFEDVGSTARHLAPMQMLIEAGIDPLKDIEVLHTSKTIQHEALKKGDVAAMGQSYESWLATAYAEESPEVQESFVVLKRSEQPPNDVLVIGTHVDPNVAEALRKAFDTYPDELSAAARASEENVKYAGMQFVTDAKDSDYDSVREMYKTAGYPEYSEFLGD